MNSGQINPTIGVVGYGRFGWFMDPEGNKVELWEPRQVETPGD